MNRRVLACIAAAALVATAAAVRTAVSRRWAGSPAVPTYQVRRAAFARHVSADGNLRAVKAEPVAAPQFSDGALKIAWLAPDGSDVHGGQVVARFDPTDFEKKLKDSESDRKSAEAKIEKERTDTGALLRDRDRTAKLSEAELEKRQKFQSKDTLIFSRNQIIESEIDKDLWTEKKSHAEGTQQIESSLSRAKVELLEIEKRKAELAIAQATKGLGNMEVTAPHDGIFVVERDWRGNLWKIGDVVWGGQRLASLPLLDEMEVEAFVLEADAGGLSIGLPAAVALEAHPETVYEGVIRNIDRLAKPRIRDVPINYFSVILGLARTDKDRMKPGQRVHVVLNLDEQQAVVVPRQAAFERDGRQVVYVATGRGFDERPVKLGASSPGLVVVESGLSDGESIALRDPRRSAEPARDDADRGPSR
jgi:RND family efflux transporter MFP subunit